MSDNPGNVINIVHLYSVQLKKISLEIMNIACVLHDNHVIHSMYSDKLTNYLI